MILDITVRAVVLFLELLLFVYFVYTVLAIFKGGAPIPSRGSVVRRLITASGVKPGETLIDLGSGDGRIVIAAAKVGAFGIGYEINPFLTRLSRFIGWCRGVKVTIHQADMWQADLSQADVVTAYLVPKFMDRLQEKVLAEMKPGSRLALAVYPLREMQPSSVDGPIHLYVIPDRAAP